CPRRALLRRPDLRLHRRHGRQHGHGADPPIRNDEGYVPARRHAARLRDRRPSRHHGDHQEKPHRLRRMASVTSPEPRDKSRRSLEPQTASPDLLSKAWYGYYVLGLLTICYVANTVDRSQVLAASLQAIKREFNATDAQLGMLSGLPFALFYSFLGIPIAAWADRSSRRNVLAWACALWSAATALRGAAVNFSMLFGARVFTAIGEAGGSPPSHSLLARHCPT